MRNSIKIKRLIKKADSLRDQSQALLDEAAELAGDSLGEVFEASFVSGESEVVFCDPFNPLDFYTNDILIDLIEADE